MAHVRVQRAVHEGRDRLFAYLDGPDAVWGMDIATGHQWWYDDTHRDLVLAGVVSHLALHQNGEAPSSVPAAPAPQLPLLPAGPPTPVEPHLHAGPYPQGGQFFTPEGVAAASSPAPVESPRSGRRARPEPAVRGRRARTEPDPSGSLLPRRRASGVRRTLEVAAVVVVVLGASVGGWSMIRSGDGAASETPGTAAPYPDNVTVGSTCLQLGVHTTTAAGAPVVCATFGARAVWTPVDAKAKAGNACAKAGNVVMDVSGSTRLVCTATKSGTPRWIVSAT